MERMAAVRLANTLKERVLGQDEALDKLAREVSLSVARADKRAKGGERHKLPRNIATLVMGTTASGKTYAIKELLRTLQVESVFVDCSSVTGSGWHGPDMSSRLAAAAACQMLSHGGPVAIVFDEFDKVARGDEGPKGFDITAELLPLFDGGVYTVTDEGKSYDLDTDGVIFIAMGAFTGIEEIVRRRLRSSAGPCVGFGSAGSGSSITEMSCEELRNQVITEDFEAWGIPRELLGRMGAPISMRSLGEQTLMRIASELSVPSFSMLMPDGCRLLVNEGGAKALACEAYETGLGARAVNSRVRSFAAVARVAMECDDDIVDAVITAADGIAELAYVRGQREVLAYVEEHPELSLEEARKRHRRIKAMKAALRKGVDAKPADESASGELPVPGAGEVFDAVFTHDAFCRNVSLEHIDAFCTRLFGEEADSASSKRSLFKALLLYVRSYCYAQEEYCTFASAFNYFSLAFWEKDKQRCSALDLLVMGSADVDDLESLRDASHGFKGERLDLAIRAMVEYGAFACLSHAAQERIAFQLIHEVCALAADRERLELIAADMKTAVEQKR